MAAKNLVAKDIKLKDYLKAKNDTYASYGVSKGETYKVTAKNGNNIMLEGIAAWVPLNVFEKSKYTRDELNRQREELVIIINGIDAKIEWMEKTNSTEYDETEFKVWSVMQKLNSKHMSELDKIKLIASLVKNS